MLVITIVIMIVTIIVINIVMTSAAATPASRGEAWDRAPSRRGAPGCLLYLVLCLLTSQSIH